MTTRPEKLASLPIHPHPEVDLEHYRLRVDGLVGRPLELTLAELQAMPQQGFDDDFACLEGWTVPDLHWRGVKLADVLDLTGATGEARWVQASFGEFSLPLPLSEARMALLALTLDDAALKPEHGAPVRLLVPGGECFTSVKWLDHLELRSEPGENAARQIATTRIGLS
jgi:DMSO/TMAO reductase YedYZ molybdopterin-dependent catalytic subunit